MDRSIRAGITSSILAILVNLFLSLAFIPSFAVVILVIYLFRLASVKEGLLVAFMTYVLSDGITGTLLLTELYLNNEPYAFDIAPYILILQLIYPFTAAIAGYVGVKLVQKLRPPTAEAQPPTSLPPTEQPIPPV